MTMIRPRSDVVYGIYRGLPSGVFQALPERTEKLRLSPADVHGFMACVSRCFTLQLRVRQTDAEFPYPRNPRGRVHQQTK